MMCCTEQLSENLVHWVGVFSFLFFFPLGFLFWRGTAADARVVGFLGFDVFFFSQSCNVPTFVM